MSLRIAIITDYLSRGGAERQAVNTARGLACKGHDVHLIYSRRSDSDYEPELAAPARVAFVPGSPRYVGLVRRLRRYLVTHEIEVAHAFKKRPSVYGAIAATLARVPVILGSYRIVYRERGALRRWHQLADRLNAGWTVNSAAVAASLARGIGADPARCFVIRNGVEAGRVQPRVSRAQARAALGLGAEAPVVAMIAALKPQKRHAMLLHAAARLLERRPATTFLLAGEGRERASIEVLAAALGIGAQVRLLGMRTDVPDVLAAADVSVLTSEHEGTPNAVLESMACGVPVVCTRFEGAEEVVTDGHDGYLVARDDLVGLV
jgi:glycosyltransferase involved in cell wall biosynthesis